MRKRVFWQRLLLVFIAVVLGLTVYSVNARRLAGEQMPMPLGFGTAVVLTGSMEPTLSADDLVFVRRSGTYAVGDVVVYQTQNSLVIHRLISLDGDTAVTQGDANNAPDEVFPVAAIKGKMIGKIGGIGRAVDVISSPAGIAVTLLLAAGLLALSYRQDRKASGAELDKIRKEIEQLKQERRNGSETDGKSE